MKSFVVAGVTFAVLFGYFAITGAPADSYERGLLLGSMLGFLFLPTLITAGIAAATSIKRSWAAVTAVFIGVCGLMFTVTYVLPILRQ